MGTRDVHASANENRNAPENSEEKIDWEGLRERIAYAKTQCLVEDSLNHKVSLFDLSRALRVCRLVSRLRFQNRLFKTREFKQRRLGNIAGEAGYFINASKGLEAMDV